MHYLSPKVYAYFLQYGHVVNRGQQNFGGFLYIGSNCSYFPENNNNSDNKISLAVPQNSKHFFSKEPCPQTGIEKKGLPEYSRFFYGK